jgi:2-polyprenyl-6-methoxyphenol hydroxylase-like FAD-dependent oxidoreductase
VAGGETGPVERVDCVIAGCGPAGAVLGLLLARAGLRVTVVENHGDFLRDFRGDTIHASTLTLLDELGLGDEFARLGQQRITELHVAAGDREWPLADFRRIPGRHREIALMPQWDFLDFVTGHAAGYPGFRLRMETEATGLLVEHGQVGGLILAAGTIPAALTVAADGRRSTVRQAARLPVRVYDAPMDVLWFRLSRRPSDRASTAGRVAPGRLLIRIDRGDYWQAGYVIEKGGYERLHAAGLDAFRSDLARLEPALADRVGELGSWSDVSVLDVRVDRLRRWHRPGLLCIGDAAHAMSPVGGIGINLAVQDAVAAANLLVRPLRTGTLSERDLARVQRRRALPTAVTQAGQRAIHRGVARLLDGGAAPPPVRLLERFPVLQAIPAYLVGIGIRPEHVRLSPDGQPGTGR